MSTSYHSEGGVTRVRRRPQFTLHARRACFVAALCAVLGLGVQNAFAAGVISAIGVVTQSSQASMGGTPVLRGQTVLDGDRLLGLGLRQEYGADGDGDVQEHAAAVDEEEQGGAGPLTHLPR